MPIISITFYMVIIRVTVYKSISSHGVTQASAGESGRLTLSRMSRLSAVREYQMKRMEVHITQLTETNEHEEYGSGSGSGSREPEESEEVDVASKVLGGFAV